MICYREHQLTVTDFGANIVQGVRRIGLRIDRILDEIMEHLTKARGFAVNG